MNESGTVTLKTERLILRRFSLDDAPDMYNNWASDDEVTKYLVWPTHSDIEVSRRVIEIWLAGYDDPKQYIWCLEDRERHEAVGSIGVVERNPANQALEIGYCLSRACWGKGLMSEALAAAASFLFTQVRAVRLEARVDQRNLKSQSVLKKCGFIFDREMAGGGLNNLGPYDAWIYRLNNDF